MTSLRKISPIRVMTSAKYQRWKAAQKLFFRLFLIAIFGISTRYDVEAQTASSAKDKGLSLKDALSLGITHSLVLKREAHNREKAKADQTTAALRPNLRLNNQTLFLTNPNAFPASSTYGNSINRQDWWQLTKPIQTTAQRQSKISVAAKLTDLSVLDFEESKRQVLSDIGEQWIQLWAAIKQKELVLMAKQNLDTLLAINRLRLKNQVITPTDLMRTELLDDQYDQQLQKASQSVSLSSRRLSLAIGLNDSVAINPESDFFYDTVSYRPEGVDNLITKAVEERSDVRYARASIEASAANERLQKSLAFPPLELGVIANPQNTIPYYGVFATIDLPFFNRNQGQIQRAKVETQQAESQLMLSEKGLQTELRNAVFDFHTNQSLMKRYEEMLKTSQQVFDNVRYAYMRGGTTILDFLEAQRAWLDIRQRYYETELDFRRSYLRILFVTGKINSISQP
jgi:cobalt-zinc-cadmium efflux system outer membrane protein